MGQYIFSCSWLSAEIVIGHAWEKLKPMLGERKKISPSQRNSFCCHVQRDKTHVQLCDGVSWGGQLIKEALNNKGA